MTSKSVYRNSKWITIPLQKVGSAPQQERWSRALMTLADVMQERWRNEYPVNPRALRKGEIT